MPKNLRKNRMVSIDTLQPSNYQTAYSSSLNSRRLKVNKIPMPDEDGVEVNGTAIETQVLEEHNIAGHTDLETPSFCEGTDSFSASASQEEPGRLTVKAKARRYEDSDAPLLTWKQKFRDEYLDWMLVTDGRGRLFGNQCGFCRVAGGKYRCIDCYGLRMQCKGCIMNHHKDQPLHRIQEWRNDYFQPITLRDLGLRVQLGHLPGERCNFIGTSFQNNFTVIAWNGLHIIAVDFCGCAGAPEHHNQLLEMGLWPASYKEPQSAATMDLLRNFHIMNLQGHVPPTDFYRTLEQMINGSGLIQSTPDRLSQFMTMLRQWRHLKTGKRAGRGHDPSGLNGTQKGSTTVPCRACPHPGINLPCGWEKAPAKDSWLYSLLLSEDANFKQKARARPNDNRDPSLGPGWGCFVENQPYIEEMVKRATQDEISHCVGFNAMYHANNKKHKGLRATGIGAVSCSRHECFRPNGIGDLQKGERYCNMDYIFLSSLLSTALLLVHVSYDIACQWMRNFYARMKSMPQHLQLPSSLKIVFKVPKFHLPAHTERCFAPFAFNFTTGVGETDGEGVERNWSWLNSSARCLSMMSAGGRWDTMDDYCNYWNWRKTVHLEDSLLKKLVKAIPSAVIHHRAYSAFTESLTVDHAQEMATWEQQVLDWECGRSRLCPYDVPESTITLAKVKKQLAEEDFQREREGRNTSDSSSSAMIIEGLELEEIQRNISVIAEHPRLSDYQESNMQNRRTNLLRRIRRFRELQLIHMPGIRQRMASLPTTDSIFPEQIALLLPSSFDGKTRTVLCSEELAALEDRLRYAQAVESLSRLRGQLRARMVAFKHSSRVLPSQGQYTKMNELQDQIEVKIKAFRQTYCAARDALWQFRGPGEWEKVLQVLKPEDIRTITERALLDDEKTQFRKAQARAGISQAAIDSMLSGVENVPTVPMHPVLARGESRRTLSWIWYTSGNAETEGAGIQEIEASLRIEWCKARARACRSQEELLLVEEEMRRSIEFCHWKSRWWLQQVGQRTEIAAWLNEGLVAYAKEQSNAELERAVLWNSRWQHIRDRAKRISSSLQSPKTDLDACDGLPPLEIELDLHFEDEMEIEDEEIDDC